MENTRVNESVTYLVEKARNRLLPFSAKVLLGVKSGPIVSGESSIMDRNIFFFTFEGYVEPLIAKISTYSRTDANIACLVSDLQSWV